MSSTPSARQYCSTCGSSPEPCPSSWAARESPEARPVSLRPDAGGGGMKQDKGTRGTRAILLVDDEQALTDLLSGIVREAGFVPLTAGEPNAAIELLEKRPLLAVVDLNLRPFDGFALIAELRRRSRD